LVYNPDKHHRRSIRLPGYDYSNPGAYFVTICSWQKECIFGEIVNGVIRLNEYGVVVNKFINNIPDRFVDTELDCSVIMPNHVHAIFIIACIVGAIHELPLRNVSALEHCKQRRIMLLSKIVGWFKMNSSKHINQIRNTPGAPLWQRNYYERVIRNETELFQLRKYIQNNPLGWDLDEENPVNIKM
jgi:REP element-mobilizing transposase RayT